MNNNPFMQAMKAFLDNANMMDKMQNMPNMNLNNMFDVMRTNQELMQNTQKLATENTQAIMRRQSEILQSNLSNGLSHAQNLSNCQNMEEATQQQKSFVADSVQSSLNDARELTEMAAKSQMELLDMVSNSLSSQVQELKPAANKNKKAA